MSDFASSAAVAPQPPKPREPGDRLGSRLPEFDLEDPGMRETLYGNFGFYEDWRAVVLANCAEIVRATIDGKVSEERIKNMARTHPLYLDFLITHLRGKHRRERAIKEQMGA